MRMKYPRSDDLKGLLEQVELYAQLKTEYGAIGAAGIVADTRKALRASLARMKKLPAARALAKQEPNRLEDIQAARPKGPRRLWPAFDKGTYLDRIEGALIGRFAGCTLGAPVEFWPIAKMKALAEENGDVFPPINYWRYVPDPAGKRYGFSARETYTRGSLDGVPVDDDVTYTLLGLLILEDAGVNFTVGDVGKAWLKYLPMACTAEKVALENLRNGVQATKAGETDNPYCEWIGADIRSDPWGYAAPGWPERAAAMAYQDAYVSHRRQGIYGEMYFSAAIAAAFAVDDPVAALRIGLTEIPRSCAMSKAVRWALRVAPQVKDYRQARDAMEEKFKGMHRVHTINNACLTIWGVTIGGTDFTRVISETVAMGMDNDCTAATAGSLVGAVVGKKGIPKHWYRNFNNKVYSYMIGRRRFAISGLVKRFAKQAKSVHGEGA